MVLGRFHGVTPYTEHVLSATVEKRLSLGFPYFEGLLPPARLGFVSCAWHFARLGDLVQFELCHPLDELVFRRFFSTASAPYGPFQAVEGVLLGGAQLLAGGSCQVSVDVDTGGRRWVYHTWVYIRSSFETRGVGDTGAYILPWYVVYGNIR